MGALSIAEIITRRLAIFLGPNTARVAVKTFSAKALGRGPETLQREDMPQLQDALRPMLRTFVGRTQCEALLKQLAEEVAE